MDRDIVQALVKTVELKDQTTAAHTWRVALYTLAFIEALGIPLDEHERYVTAAVLHDVGKVDIPESILTKSAALDPDEFEIMKTHTTLGYERLVRMGETDPILLQLVRSHHERIDGSGYPDALSDEQVPSPARLFAVIDSFDAMTSHRPYRRLLPAHAPAAALQELKRQAGTRYCADAVERFGALYRSGSLDWILHHFNGATAESQSAVVPDHAALRVAREQLIDRPEIVVRPVRLSGRASTESNRD